MYTLIGAPKTRTFRVIWMLEELEQDYELQPEPPRSERVREVNPLGKVPVLLDGAAALRDSTAILTYLADKHSALTFPPGTVDRAHQDAVTHFLLDELDSVLWTAARHSFVLPEARRVPEVKDSLKWEFGESERRLALILGESPFLCGEAMTIADIIAVHCLSWARSAKFPTDVPALRDYAERLQSRPAYRRAALR